MSILQFLGSVWKRITGETSTNEADEEAQMRKMEKINCRMMRRALNKSGLKYDFDEENENFIIGFHTEDAESLSFLLVIHSGTNSFRAHGIGSEVEDLKLKDALLFCNKWNSENLFPKVFVAPGDNRISSDMLLTLGHGANREYVQQIILHHFIKENCDLFNAAEQCDFLKKLPLPEQA